MMAQFLVQFQGGERRMAVSCDDLSTAHGVLDDEFSAWERHGRPAIPNNPMIYNAVGVIRLDGKIISTRTA
jgi:hypothetical protein